MIDAKREPTSGCLLRSVRVQLTEKRGGQEKRRNGSAGERAWPGSAGCQLAAGASAEILL